MRKVLRTADISVKKFRLLILKPMKINIDELIRCSNFIESEITKWFLNYREEIIKDVIKAEYSKYMKEYLNAIKKYEKIRRREIQKTFNKYSQEKRELKLQEKEKCLEIINSDRYVKDKQWRQNLNNLLGYGPIYETTNCMMIKKAIKEEISDELKEVIELLPERIVNAIIMQKYKVFRNQLNALFSGKARKALENYPMIDIHVTLNKLQLGYVKFSASENNPLSCYIGYKKDSKLYPFERDKYKFELSICDEETLNNINIEGVNMVDITKDEQFEVYITRENKHDTYLLYINHGVRIEYDDIICNDKSLILRSNDETYELEPVNNLLEGCVNINIKNADTNMIIRELTKKYSQLINLDNLKNEFQYNSINYVNTHNSIINKLDEICRTYIKLSLNIAMNIEKYCTVNNTNIVIIYYRPDSNFNTNKITMNGKIIKYLIKYLSEMGIECILIDQTNNSSNLYRKFKEADIYPEHYSEINSYVLDQLKNTEFTNEILNQINNHNNSILKNDRMGIKRIYCNGNTIYYL